MLKKLLAISLVLLSAVALPAQAEAAHYGYHSIPPHHRREKPGFVQRPDYNTLRFNEDWSVLLNRPPEQNRETFDPLKYIELDRNGDFWLSLGGHVRARSERWSNFNFDPVMDDFYTLWRVYAHADLHYTENFRLFTEIKSANLISGRDLPGGRRTTDTDVLGLQNLFADYAFDWGPGDRNVFTFRVGRHELLFGAQRLVSPLDWANVRRTFDGVSAIYEQEGHFSMHAFWTQPVKVRKYHSNTHSDDQRFAGLYNSYYWKKADTTVDLYFMYLRNSSATFNFTSGRERRYTIGARLAGKIDDWHLDWDVEGAGQFGSVGTADINAYMVDASYGYEVQDVWGDPRIQFAFGAASGDPTAGDNEVKTFNQLFPLSHAYLGWMDLVARQNVIYINPRIVLRPCANMDIVVQYLEFWRHKTGDALYAANGSVLRASGSTFSKSIGQEVDLLVRYAFDRHIFGYVGYSYFFPRSVILQSMPTLKAEPGFFYVGAQFTF